MTAVLIALALPVAVGCAPAKVGAPPDVYSRINQIRAENGAGPLNACPTLAAAAQAHANDMAATGVLSHSGSDGSDPPTRLQRSGYGAGHWGEAVARGQPTTESVLAGWMASPAHRNILLDRSYHDVGLGYANGFWVADFGSGGRC